MKKLMLVCLVSFSFLIGCEGNGNVRIGGDNEAVLIRVGYDLTENNEIGLSTHYYPNEENDSQNLGIYVLRKLPDIATIPNPFGGEVNATGYVGFQTVFDDNDYDDYISPFAGFEFWDNFFVEVQYEPFDNKATYRNEEFVGVLGWRVKF